MKTKKSIAMISLFLAFCLLALGGCAKIAEGIGGPDSLPAIKSPVTGVLFSPLAPLGSSSPEETTGPADTTAPPEPPNPRNDIVICVDAGHGGYDSGTGGLYNRVAYAEKDIALTVALMVKDELLALGYQVMMTRSDDTFVELGDRRIISSNAKAAMFVSVHCNSFGGSGRAWGTEVYYYDNSAAQYNAPALASVMCRAIETVTPSYPAMRDVVRAKGDMAYLTYNLAVLKNAHIPSLLVELGYMSDESDMSLFANPAWLADMAHALAQGVEDAYAAGMIAK